MFHGIHYNAWLQRPSEPAPATRFNKNRLLCDDAHYKWNFYGITNAEMNWRENQRINKILITFELLQLEISNKHHFIQNTYAMSRLNEND